METSKYGTEFLSYRIRALPEKITNKIVFNSISYSRNGNNPKIDMRPCNGCGSIKTAMLGDYLVIEEDGQAYIITENEFLDVYEDDDEK
jgi:hypothetical protein